MEINHLFQVDPFFFHKMTGLKEEEGLRNRGNGRRKEESEEISRDRDKFMFFMHTCHG